MKKLMILFAGVILIGTSACRKVTENYYTTPNKTIYDIIQEEEWRTDDGGETYYFSIPMPEINQAAYDLDGTLVYGSFVDGEDEPIPSVYGGYTYTYVVKVGQIIIKVQSTQLGVIPSPPTLPIKVVLIASEE